MKNPNSGARQAAAKPDTNCLEVNVAVDWWVLQLTGAMMNMHTSGPAVAKCFERSLRDSLHTKYKGHWHEHQPSLGSGYRSLSYGVHMDPMLQKAGNDAGISDLEKWLQSTRHKVMFVDPRLVRIRPNCRSPNMEILYEASELDSTVQDEKITNNTSSEDEISVTSTDSNSVDVSSDSNSESDSTFNCNSDMTTSDTANIESTVSTQLAAGIVVT